MKLIQILWAPIMLVMVFSSCSKTWHISSQKVTYQRFDDRNSPAEDEATSELIEPYRSQMEAEMNEVISISEVQLTKTKPESTMGNWFADLIRIEAEERYGKKVDFALQNYGGLRIPSLSAGKITVGKIYELMPFDNKLIVMDVKGDVVLKMLNRVAEYGGWPLSEGLRFQIVNGKAENIEISGKPFDPNKDYAFALPDYIANGGDDCDFLINENQIDLNIMLRDAVIHRLRLQHEKGIKIVKPPMGRIKTTP